ncbi:MAG: TraX family protein [Pseudomonadota bacterium]|nr:TraX family protein [Pseudomonadota bacterium]
MTEAIKSKLPTSITSYDLLKAFAVIIMICDHIGFYFYPDDMWWRAIGRIGFPVWFFLIGYAHSREITKSLLIGSVILLVTAVIFGMYVFPLSALVTIICLRLVIDRVGRGALSSMQAMAGLMIGCVLIALPTGILVEYGTMALAFAVFGYMVRARQDGRDVSMDMQVMCMMLATMSFVLVQHFTFKFSEPQLYFVGIGTLGVMLILFFFSKIEFSKLTNVLPQSFKVLIQFLGRRTLEIYVAHLVLFRVAGLILDPERFKIIQPTLFFTS